MQTHRLPQGVIDAEAKRAATIPTVRIFMPDDFVGSLVRERNQLHELGYDISLQWLANGGVKMEVRDFR